MRIFADADFWIKMQIFVDADVAFTLKMQLQMLKNCKCKYGCKLLKMQITCGCLKLSTRLRMLMRISKNADIFRCGYFSKVDADVAFTLKIRMGMLRNCK